MTDRTRGLGGYTVERRRQLGLSQSRAASLARASRTSWVAWEKGTATPEDYSYVKIERALEWAPGSVAAVLAGGEPTPLVAAVPEPLDEERAALFDLYQRRRDAGIGHEEAMARLQAGLDRLDREHRATRSGDRGRHPA